MPGNEETFWWTTKWQNEKTVQTEHETVNTKILTFEFDEALPKHK
jgi:hypothetical protein